MEEAQDKEKVRGAYTQVRRYSRQNAKRPNAFRTVCYEDLYN